MDKLYSLMQGLQELIVKSNQLQWTLFTVGYDFGIESADDEMRAYLEDKAHYKIVLDALENATTEEEKRKAEIAKKEFEPYHQSEEVNKLIKKIEDKTNALMKILNAFRFKLDGKETTSVELTQILMCSEDRELRRRAYLSRNQVNKPLFEAGFLELIEMRKQLAELCGFDSFVDYKFYQDDLSATIFDDWKDEVKSALPEIKKIRTEFARKYLNDDTIYPWDESYISGRIAPSVNASVDMLKFYDVVKAYYAKFGFDLDQYGIVYDVYSRKNKSEWGYFFPIDIGRDARVLANVKDRYHEYNVLMHETGHAVHSSLKNRDEVILNNGVSGIVTEGIANLFGSQIYDVSFFAPFFEGDIETVQKEFDAYSKWKKINAFRAIGSIMFDQNFYRKDLESLEDIYDMHWEINEEYFEEARGDFEPPWAYRIHHTSHPIYLHNYFMGDVTCEMLRSVFKEKEGVESIVEKAELFGKFLYDEVIKPSGMYPYNDLFKRISGNDFSLKYLMQ